MKKFFCTIALLFSTALIFSQPNTNVGCPDDKHPHALDLGLPSGTKWACCNIGACNPCDDGKYFAWGETETKFGFYYDNYKYYDPSGPTIYKFIGNNIAASQYDAATVLWGSGWCIPTDEQCKELIKYCEMETLSCNNNCVALFTSPSGNRLWMPFSGQRESENIHEYGKKGYYWTSVPDKYDSMLAFFMEVYFDPSVYLGCRNCGYCIRPVQKMSNIEKTSGVSSDVDVP